MRKRTVVIMLFTLMVTSLHVNAQWYHHNPYQKDKIACYFHKNVEFLGFVYFMAFETYNLEDKIIEIEGEPIAKKDWHQFGYRFYQDYKEEIDLSQLDSAFQLVDHLWLDYLNGFLLQVGTFPNASLTGVSESTYLRFSKNKNSQEAEENARFFLETLNDFYRSITFDRILQRYQPFYDKAFEELINGLNKTRFTDELEEFYGKRNPTYTFIPSLTTPKGMGFAIFDEKKKVNLFGAPGPQQLKDSTNAVMGFNNMAYVKKISMHELGHTFSNPVVASVPEAWIEETSILFELIVQQMRDQGYNTWKVSLYEHFVRASEIQIALKYDRKEEAEALKEEYIVDRDFRYIPIILDAFANADLTYSDRVDGAFERLIIHANSENDTTKVVLHTEDVERFWEVYDQTKPKFKGKVWQSQYLDPGSKGLKAFIPMRIESGRKLAKTVKKQQSYYEETRKNLPYIKGIKDTLENNFRAFKTLYPETVFPEVYFVMGRRNTGGTAFSGGIIMGFERFGLPSSDSEPDIHLNALDDIVFHEFIHFQQQYVRENTLLAQCIREGAADFLTYLVKGAKINPSIHEFGHANEAVLWEEFITRKDSNNWSGWLYGGKLEGRPKDMGYWMGFKICEAYYQQATNKKQAVADMLNIKDFNQFLKTSGYNGRSIK